MKTFECAVCGNALYFENSRCVSCGTRLGYDRGSGTIVPVDDEGVRRVDGEPDRYVCRNLALSGCTWLTDTEGGICFACSLTRTRPNDSDTEGMERFPVAERAKRYLVAELDALGIPVIGKEPAFGGDPDTGLCFDILSEGPGEKVTIGHANGVITINLAEGDDAYRERMRDKLDEPYRTMLGHFRHESGHYFEWRLVDASDDEELRARVEEVFGDASVSYQDAIDRHYEEGPPEDWHQRYISAYATMHPWEDFAETWAHFLHITDTLDTARAFGLVSGPVSETEGAPAFRTVVSGRWIPLAIALNMINRSMGKDDLYPFVIRRGVLDKLDVIADLHARAAAG